MKKFFTMLAFGLLFPLGVIAQVNPNADAVDAEFFKPAIGGGIFGVDRAQILGNYKLYFGAFVNYARNPLVVLTEKDGEIFSIPVRDQSALDIVASVGLGDRIELGFAIPTALFMDGDELSSLGGVGVVQSGQLGDVRLGGKLRLVGNPNDPLEDGARLALQLEAKLPTGEALNQSGVDSFFADKSPAFAAAALGDYKAGRFTFTGNLGIRIRTTDQINVQNVAVGNELILGGGLDFQANDRLHGAAEIDALANLEKEDVGSIPAEARIGIKIGAGRFQIPVGVGAGINDSFSAPDFRVFLGLNYTGLDLDPDRDGDLVLDKVDGCPVNPEDKDGFADKDGCPDIDNDQDGIVDNNDRCPNNPEDQDSFEDIDGCPELDNDKDGVTDLSDLCPREAEDRDSFEDIDGCPELDNDKDSIVDLSDLCPNQPENRNGEKDIDGCPDDVIAALYCGEIVILDMIFFDTNKTTIKSVSYPVLDAVAKVLKENPELQKIRVQGNADDVGSNSLNQTLSEGRAQTVVDYLVKSGVHPSRLEAAGDGESKPLAPVSGLEKEALEDARDQNRRVEFFVVSTLPLNSSL